MAKAKRKPDFSKPKPQKSAEVVEQEEVIPQTVEAEFDDDSDDWNIEDTSNIIEDSEEYASKVQD